MIRSYFKIAFRCLIKNKLYSFINIVGLSLSLCCVILIIAPNGLKAILIEQTLDLNPLLEQDCSY